jgi:N-acetylglucosamine malate deacetylase 1
MNNPMNSFGEYVRGYVDLLNDGAALPLASAEHAARLAIAPDAPTVMIFSPHPDDEIIMGGLPLRLMRQNGWRVVNVAVTQGSNPERQAGRWVELQNCCDAIDFELIATVENGLTDINDTAARENGTEWKLAAERIKEILGKYNPRVILFPHFADWNTTHIGTHLLLLQALQASPAEFQPYVCETEFWGQMPNPNFAVESSPTEVADLISALSYHAGEVQRNPYHLSLPAWMIDNVRRAEVVAGQGKASPAMQFATLLRLGRWTGSELQPLREEGTFLPLSDNPADLFPA